MLSEETILDGIRQIVDRDDVMVVIGSILTSSSAPNTNDTNYHLGDHLLDVYYRLHPKSSRKDLHALLKAADNYEDGNNNGDEPYSDVLLNALNYSDIVADHVISNTCYICTKNKIFTVLKQYKSKEDFILNSVSKDAPEELKNGPFFLQTTTKYKEIQENKDGVSSIFDYGGIRFGVEICLDHKKARIKSAGYSKQLDVQLVPSCGMNIHPESVFLRTGGYIFNCDGEYVIEEGKEGQNGIDSHTSLRTMKSQGLGDAFKTTNDIEIEYATLQTYFRHNKFNIHFYQSTKI